MRKTILLLVSIFTVTLFSFTHTTRSYAKQYPAQRYPAQQPTGPTLDQLKEKNFTVRTLNGESVNLNTLIGEGKPVLIDFWATWCGPCRMVIPHLAELHRKYGKDGLVIIGMNLEDPRAEGQPVRDFVKRFRMDYQNVFASHAIYQFFSGLAAARIPYTLVFGPDGKLIWRLVGYSPQISSALNGAVAKAMAGAPEKPAEQGTPEKQPEQAAPEKPAEQGTPVKPAEQGTPEKPADQGAPEKPADQGTPEKQVEKGTPEKPTKQEAPETKPCNCPCCSSRAPEKKTEPGAPEKPKDQ
ncbi:MAG TPA: redoxin domain-containing protein [Blastocatellia bacterium]|nr:redoxin domain-containing protein [Blastocatellia bacterium]